MSFQQWHEAHQTNIDYVDHRLAMITRLVGAMEPSNILDLGCGDGLLIRQLKSVTTAALTGIDAAVSIEAEGWTYCCADLTTTFPFPDASFDCVVAGEVIEHVPSPDFMLSEIFRVLTPGGRLVISTPNLVSWANRILVPLGIQPLFTETSSAVNLGRVFKALGQHSTVQGHLKIFTYRSLAELLEREGFTLQARHGTKFFFPYPISLIDGFMARYPAVASGLVYVAEKPAT
jgi:2-polyprenyl-3-methyl-5-hydroxy-6-metoxy-1,4-benzoquinol methylase